MYADVCDVTDIKYFCPRTNVSLLNEQIKSTRDMVTKERAEK